jgi:8-oxo-dGTP diphosphatase
MGGTEDHGSPRGTNGAAIVDWNDWKPVDRATLVFVVDHGEILLIRKKRGLGAGKLNGPGGKLEAGESVVAGAVREVEEELLVTPTGLHERGELSFQFTDGYSIHVTVFFADGCDGDPQETAEAIPIWTPIDRIPYDEMWEDDRIWIPLMLANRPFRGRFLFDGDAMLTSTVECDGPA